MNGLLNLCIIIVSLFSSCSEGRNVVCKELKADFDSYVVKEYDNTYYWNGEYNSLESVFKDNESCIKLLSSLKLNDQFLLLTLNNNEYQYRIRVSNDELSAGAVLTP